MGIGSLGAWNLGFQFWRACSAINMLKCKSPQTLKQTLCPERFEIGLGRDCNFIGNVRGWPWGSVLWVTLI